MPLDSTSGTPAAPATPAAAAVADTPPAAAAGTPSQPGATTPPAAVPPTVTITSALYDNLISQQAENVRLQAAQRERDDKARQEKLDLMVQQGKYEDVVRETRADADRRVQAVQEQRIAIEERAKRYAVDGELSRALAGLPLNPGAAEQLTHLFRGNFTAAPEGEGFSVRTAGGQNAAEFIAATLAQSNYAHFRPAMTQGGTAGTSGGAIGPPTPAAHAAMPAEPNTLSEAIIMNFQAREALKPTDPRLDLRSGMGLRRAK